MVFIEVRIEVSDIVAFFLRPDPVSGPRPSTADIDSARSAGSSPSGKTLEQDVAHPEKPPLNGIQGAWAGPGGSACRRTRQGATESASAREGLDVPW
ncbi:hypothetical protein GCM10010182_10530 [Actinomadura cremea]|nr:hypothetical protein GCM10010182_10530 [Actinomadura cremea]